ncbi:LysR substrate-binding domain-containing protein [Micromonospora sp. WMMA1363]|uniref:LysR substrate-binding domain-containing protein n=1 Tax=Micromonospora sp. WMMA1363 TaxID=3053985 RepID=UPI00259CBA9E|nr:LysR substrate-binding domain-containing protein [Micromonospora sp. WMMA1363]MDM4719685.1 LysR substrate-binding domain-containing protein [Micromonospora sp. WMMA1363]
MRLTEAGRVLAEHAERILIQLDTAERAVAAVADGSGGRLRVAAFATACTIVVPALAAFRRRHTGVDLSFTEMEPEEALPAVRDGHIDLAVTHHYAHVPPSDMRGLHQTGLHDEPLLLAAPPKRAPAVNQKIDLRQFADVAWVSTRPSTGFQAVTELAGQTAGFLPTIAFRADSYHLLLALVGAGLGVALVPAIAAIPTPGVNYHNIAHPPGLHRRICAVTRSADPFPAAAALIQNLTRQLRQRR